MTDAERTEVVRAIERLTGKPTFVRWVPPVEAGGFTPAWTGWTEGWMGYAGQPDAAGTFIAAGYTDPDAALLGLLGSVTEARKHAG